MLQSYKLHYKSTGILSGADMWEHFSSELKNLGIRNPIVIANKTMEGADDALSLLSQTNMAFGSIVDSVNGDASLADILNIRDIFKKKQCDAVIAVGDEGVMDTAKGVNVLVSQEWNDFFSYAGPSCLSRSLFPVVFIPLKSAMGACVSSRVVINGVENNIRVVIASPLMSPDLVLLLPEGPVYHSASEETAIGGMASLATAIDSYLSLGEHDDLMASFAFKVVELIRKAILMPGQDRNRQMGFQYKKNAVDNLLHAAVLAGLVNSSSGLITALGRSAKYVCDIPQDIAMAVLLPFALENRLNSCEPKIARLLLPMIGKSMCLKIAESKRGVFMLYHVMQLMKALDDLFEIPLTLKQLHVPQEKLEFMAWMTLQYLEEDMPPDPVSIKEISDILTRAFV